ncbi:MAG: hypothetical protein ACK42F_05440, partial [Sphingobacteriales bacterium]
MNLDRNSVIGLVLLALLFFGYFYYTRQGQIELEAQRKRTEDSIARLKPKVDIVSKTLDSLRSDTLTKTASAGQFVNSSFGKEEIIVVENDLVKIGFSNKGGQPAFVQLKKYLSQDSTPVTLANSDFDRLTYRINT